MKRLFLFVLFGSWATISYGQYDQVNSVYDEQYPVITPNGASMYFTRANHPENIGGTRDKGDIWYSTLVDDKWSSPVNAGSNINNKNWNGVLGFSQNGDKMLLHHHYQDNKQGLSISRKTTNGWGIPQSLKIPYFQNKSTLQSGSISDDGSMIVLSIESYNTKGAEDIYVLFNKSDGSWTDPKNLGSIINTSYQEISPYLAEDNKTLFFTSNGHSNGKGSFDVYSTTRQDGSWTQWSPPKNLGSQVNTEGRESSYQYFSDSKTAMYVNTLDSDGYGDIKSVARDEKIQSVKQESIADTELEIDTTLARSAEALLPRNDALFRFVGNVNSAKTGKLLNSTLLITALEADTILNQIDCNGNFDVLLLGGTYHLGVESKGYLSKFLTVKIDNVATNYHIEMSPIVVGETVNLKSVLFEQATAQLMESSYDELDAVVKMMEANASMEIELGGHTDNRGLSKLNYQLSEKRVKTVKKYLQSKGISGRRIVGIGYGGSRPIASNKNEKTRKFNRRVEFTVTKN